MKIAIATDDFENVAAHAGKAVRWLCYDCTPGAGTDAHLRDVRRVELARREVFHYWDDSGPHPLDGVEVIVARSAGDGFLRRMKKRGVAVQLTGETVADAALLKMLAGQDLPDPRWDPSLLLCRLRDVFSRH
jgi:predicted Fe-Mo cluster-binding NifX family protein